jgi:hypothetical protein
MKLERKYRRDVPIEQIFEENKHRVVIARNGNLQQEVMLIGYHSLGNILLGVRLPSCERENFKPSGSRHSGDKVNFPEDFPIEGLLRREDYFVMRRRHVTNPTSREAMPEFCNRKSLVEAFQNMEL